MCVSETETTRERDRLSRTGLYHNTYRKLNITNYFGRASKHNIFNGSNRGGVSRREKEIHTMTSDK